MNIRNRAAAMAMALAITCTAAPAAAQSLLDTFRSIKSDVERMSGKRKAAPTTQEAVKGQASDAASPVADDAQGGLFLSTVGDDTSDTKLSSVPMNRRDPGTFDILGMKLGMSPREVNRVASRIPIPRKFGQPAWRGTFELEATRIANRSLSKPLDARSPRTISTDWGVMRDGSGVEAQFTLEPAGPRLSHLMYQTKPNGQTQEQIRAAIIAKYGKPDWDMGYQMFWCGGVPDCRGGALSNSDMFKVYMNDDSVNFDLYRSSAYAKRAEQVINARAQEIAGKAGKPIAF